MAYNILKGNVEGSVDQHADQEIDGVKVFKNTVSASVFWDTDAQSPCATMKDVAIKTIKGNVNNGVMICDKENGARTHHNLTYNSDTETLTANTLCAKTFVGSGLYLQDIPTDAFVGQISANFVNHGFGLQNVRGALQIKTNNGISLDEDGIGLNLTAEPGLSIKSNKISVDPSALSPINIEGQNTSDNDILIIADVSRGSTRQTTLSNLYTSYIDMKVPHAAGTKGEIQFKGKKEFQSSAGLTFDPSNNTLQINGKTSSNTVISKSKMICEGAVHYNITKVTQANYDVTNSDYTIICDTRKNNINIKLPHALNNTGRVVIIKKTGADHSELSSNKVNVTCDEGKIDSNDNTEIKMTHSSRTFQSDGENWHIIGTKGT
ncbi:MAG: hypothetical protein ACYTEW_19660 [Planctomycetota bacterium]|jgi:hypothetical protein